MQPNSLAKAIALAALLLAGVAPDSTAGIPGGADSLLPRIVSRLESDIDALELFSYRERSEIERRSRTGEVSSREQRLSEIYHQDGQRMRRTLVEGADTPDAPPPAQTDGEPSLDLEDLASCFNFSQGISEPLADRIALRLDFSAIPDCLQAPGRAARILGNLDGRIWIDSEGYDLLRIEGHLRSPVTFGFGVLGKVETFDLEVEREAVSPGVFAMTRLEYHAKGRIFPLRRFDLRTRRVRSSFEPLPGDALSSSTTTPSPRRSSDPDQHLRTRS